MNIFKNLKLQTKLVGAIGSIIVVGIIILSLVITSRVADNMEEDAKKIISLPGCGGAGRSCRGCARCCRSHRRWRSPGS